MSSMHEVQDFFCGEMTFFLRFCAEWLHLKVRFDGPLNAVVNGFGVSECERIFDTVVE